MPTSNGQPVQTLDPSDKQSSVHEPSMEDILASIRRIIAADQTGAGMRSGLAAANREAPAEVSITDAGEPHEPSRAPGVSVSTAEDVARPAISGQTWDDDVHPSRPQSRSDVKEPASPSTPRDVEVRMPGGSHVHVAANVERPFDTARHESIFPRTPDWPTDEVQDAVPPEAEVTEDEAPPLISDSVGASVSSSFQALANTVLIQDPEAIERMARETLRPMLKAWLDENLPSMVERLVRAEIERVARGGR